MNSARATPSGWWGLLWLAACTVLAAWWLSPPQPEPNTAPASSFSAERATGVLRGLIGDVGPHPLGSPQARVVETRLIRHLRALGLHPEVRPRTICVGNRCARVRNVVALLPGADPQADLVLLSAHYDSVRSGPGAGDDGAGVAAILEIARALRFDGPLERGVLIVLNEGEELGLLGAQAFMQQSPWASRIASVVNIEARGTTGPSYLFEIAGSTATVAQNYGWYATSPAVSSTYIAVYRMLPNNTDVSVFAESDLPAANLAFLGGGGFYHTPLDDLDHLNPGSLQHHGEQGLGLVRAMAAAEMPEVDPPNDVVFDVLGLVILHWPEAWAVPLAGLATALGLAGLVGLFLRRWVSPLALLGALALVIGWTALTVALAFGADWALTQVGSSWHAQSWPFRMGIWSMVLALAALAGMVATRLGPNAVWGAVVIVQGAAAITLAVVLPGASYLTLIPAFGLVLPLAGRALRADDRTQFLLDAAATLPSIFALQMALALETALGLSGITVAAPLVVALWPILPWLHAENRWRSGPGWRAAAMAGGVSLLALAICPLMPSASKSHPQGMQVTAWDDGQRTTWTAQSRTWPRAAPLPPTWSADGSTTARGAAESTGEAVISVRSTFTKQRLDATIFVDESADECRIKFPDSLTALSVEGQAVNPAKTIVWLGTTPGGLAISAVTSGESDINVHVTQGTTGLAEGLPTVPAGWVPIHDGFRIYRAGKATIRR